MGAAGCGDASSSGSPEGALLAGREGRPDVPVPTGPPPKKLVVEQLAEGSGPPAKPGDELRVRYFSFDYRTHRIYEDNWKSVNKLSFTLGDKQVLGAFEVGLRGLKAGGRRELIVPKASSWASVDQVYVVELLSITPPDSEPKAGSAPVRRVKGTGSKPTLRIPPGPPPEELIVREFKPGSGKGATLGQRLSVRYIARKYGTTALEDRWDEKYPYMFVLGDTDIRKGWNIGLQGMKLGARRELILPSRLAYETGAIVYVIELLAMEEPPDQPPDR